MDIKKQLPDIKIEYLFLEYANADLKTNPEFLLSFLKCIQAHNQEVFFRIKGCTREDETNTFIKRMTDPYYIPPWELDSNHAEFDVSMLGSPIPEIFSHIIDTCEALESVINSSYPQIYANSEIRYCNGELNKKFIPLGETVPVQSIPVDSDIRRISLDGAFFWAACDDGCNGCRYYDCYGRDQIKKDRDINCVVCDHAMVCDTLDKVIDGDDLESMMGFNVLMDTMDEIIKKSPFYKECIWIDSKMLSSWNPYGGQQFSRFVLGCIGHSLLSFLNKDLNNREKLKRCQYCNDYFISTKNDTRQVHCSKECRLQAYKPKKIADQKENRKYKRKLNQKKKGRSSTT
ncbi:hypothetical protein [Desulfobacula sp.]|uniref:hypothetical protein n=1 Tax=Desulfobacula sp. TaxID=2593537 RepID=UPI00262C8A0D|nr:hypothetical protein [Desulfobacula sp.]